MSGQVQLRMPPHRLWSHALAALGLLILTLAGAMLLAGNQRAASRAVVHTITVERALVEGLERFRALESAQRGYLIIGNRDELDAYAAARREARAAVGRIRALTLDNPSQTENADHLRAALDRRIAVADRIVVLRREGRVAEAVALAASGRGPKLTDALAARVEAMSEIERQLFEQRARRARQLGWLLTGGQMLMMVLMLVGAWLVVTAFRRRADELAEAMAGRDEAEARVRHLQKMESIGQLTGGIAHDFNNMLAIIIGSLDMAEHRMSSDPGRARKFLEDAREGAELAARLTARLLAFSRQQPLSPKPVDVSALVARMRELLARALGEQVAVETIVQGDVWNCLIDPPQLESAILNLAVNARDAMPEGGRLIIETGNVSLGEAYARHRQEVKPGDYVMISVSDSGSGMAPDVIERAFDPFFTTKEVGKGTGLGLSQVYGFIKQSGGHVALYSEEGEGTVVKLYLPRLIEIEDMPRRDPCAPTPARLERARGGEVVLVVEDEEKLRHFSTEALTELGYTVLAVPDGPAALDLLAARRDVALLFTDVVMPGMNGRELADAACALIPGLRILYTTGYTRNAVVHNGVLDEGVSLLAKPFTLAELATRVRSAIDGDPDCRY